MHHNAVRIILIFVLTDYKENCFFHSFLVAMYALRIMDKKKFYKNRCVSFYEKDETTQLYVERYNLGSFKRKIVNMTIANSCFYHRCRWNHVHVLQLNLKSIAKIS